MVVKSLSRIPLFVTPWTVACQAPLSMGFSRQEYWSGLPFPWWMDCALSKIQGIFPTQESNPALQADFLPTGVTREAPLLREASLSRQALSFKRTNSIVGSCIMAGKSHNRKPRKWQAGWFASKPLGILQSISMELIITPASFCPFLVFRRQSRHWHHALPCLFSWFLRHGGFIPPNLWATNPACDACLQWAVLVLLARCSGPMENTSAVHHARCSLWALGYLGTMDSKLHETNAVGISQPLGLVFLACSLCDFESMWWRCQTPSRALWPAKCSHTR